MKLNDLDDKIKKPLEEGALMYILNVYFKCIFQSSLSPAS
jgi:hypothetical protein